jgi:(p)ppGpp synthase/HD superfamily hydrolase
MENKLERAIKLVFIAHKGQIRRNSNIDFSYHPITVGFMLKDYGCKEDIVITGFLHDLIEDTSYGYDYIKDNYSTTIADNILLLSEDMSIKDFRLRKEAFINKLKNISDELLLVELFDKTHNLLSDYELYQTNGKQVFTYRSVTYEDNKWYYNELLNLFNEKIEDKKILKRYKNLVEYYFD